MLPDEIIEIPREISNFDFPDTISISDVYGLKTVPELTRRNFEFLVEKYNELIEYLNKKEGN